MAKTKLKTKSSVKKRFTMTASGRVRRAQMSKRHGMIKRTKKQIRNLRGTVLVSRSDEARFKNCFAPYGL